MQRIKVSSSDLDSVGYDEIARVLEVAFLRGGVYQFFDVPARVYKELMTAPSHGIYFDRNIKKAGYRYKKVS